MSVGHGGNNSKHTGLEKLFILEYLEAKFTDAVIKANKRGVHVQVFDPYNTSMDFFILLSTGNRKHFSDSFAIYELVHKEYQLINDDDKNNKNINNFKVNWVKALGSVTEYNKMRDATLGVDFGTIHASSSQTTLYFTASQVSEFYGLTAPKEKLEKIGPRVWEPKK
jgi:hypothetical protein